MDGSSAAWGDYDNDGDLDIIISGNKDILPFTRIYRNEGNNKFTSMSSIALTPVGNCSVKWADYNNDGYLDILLTGGTGSTAITKLYQNNGDGTFEEDTSANIAGVSYSSAAWGDYDNDGDLDLLLAGDMGGTRISKVFSNNGDGTFTEQSKISLIGISSGSVSWADYDNDNDLDILLCGATGDPNKPRITLIYKNNGDSTFTEQTQIYLTALSSNSGISAWGDYNNDGYLDILLTGHSGTTRMAKIYKNNGNNTFTELSGLSLTGVNYSAVAWGDYDNDGYLDILLTGFTGNSRVTNIYKNNADDTFTELTNLSITPVNYSSVAWGDYDNDGDLDILISGYDGSNKVTKIYRNNSKIKNSVPSIPTNLYSLISNNIVTFTWDKSTDSETPQNGLEYNLVIGSSSKAVDIVSPMSEMSDSDNGYRRIIALGNVNHNNGWTIKGLVDGNYFWSVQAIDATYKGSIFAPEKSFNIITSSDDGFSSKSPTEYILYNNYPNPFNPSTIIKYSLPKQSFVTLKIYDILGNEITTLWEGNKPAGNFEVNFDGKNLSSGLYFYRLQTEGFVQTRKMIFLK